MIAKTTIGNNKLEYASPHVKVQWTHLETVCSTLVLSFSIERPVTKMLSDQAWNSSRDIEVKPRLAESVVYLFGLKNLSQTSLEL